MEVLQVVPPSITHVIMNRVDLDGSLFAHEHAVRLHNLRRISLWDCNLTDDVNVEVASLAELYMEDVDIKADVTGDPKIRLAPEVRLRSLAVTTSFEPEFNEKFEYCEPCLRFSHADTWIGIETLHLDDAELLYRCDIDLTAMRELSELILTDDGTFADYMLPKMEPRAMGRVRKLSVFVNMSPDYFPMDKIAMVFTGLEELILRSRDKISRSKPCFSQILPFDVTEVIAPFPCDPETSYAYIFGDTGDDLKSKVSFVWGKTRFCRRL